MLGACLQGLLGASFERGHAFVLDAIRNAEPDAVRLALLALGESRDERGLPALREYAESAPEKDVRTTALLALSISRLPPAIDYLLETVRSAPERRALEALAALESLRFDAALVDRLRELAVGRGGAALRAFQARFA